MSVGPTALSEQVAAEFTVENGVHSPQTARRSRALLPGFARRLGGSVLHVVGAENVDVNLTVPALAAGASSTVTATQGLETINAVALASTDIGRTIIGNVSVSPLPNVLPGHPEIAVSSNQGTPPSGEMRSGQAYTGLSLTVSCTVYAVTAATGGTMTLSATVLLLGTASGNQLY